MSKRRDNIKKIVNEQKKRKNNREREKSIKQAELSRFKVFAVCFGASCESF